jgi:uncharacterized membrane protein
MDLEDVLTIIFWILGVIGAYMAYKTRIEPLLKKKRR